MSKLTDHPKLLGTMPGAYKDPCYRKITVHNESEQPATYQQTRFFHTVDEQENVLSAGRTNFYHMVQNRDFVSALDLAAGEAGLNLVPNRGTYHNGTSRYTFEVPELRIQPPGDRSPTIPTIRLTNDYKGTGGLGVSSGWYRLVCKNGMVVGEILHKSLHRHVGDIDVYRIVADAIAACMDRFEVDRILAHTLAETPYFDNQAFRWENVGKPEAAREALANETSDRVLVDTLLANTAAVYHQDLAAAVRWNAADMGNNLWAMAQAVAEIATHRMQNTATGRARQRPNMGADAWATRMLQSIVAEVK